MKRVCLFILLFVPLLAFPQQIRRCGTYENWQAMKQHDPSLAIEEERINHEANEWIDAHKNERGINSIITIPVVVHVLYHSDVENISDMQIQSQVDVLNKDFARLNVDTILTPAVWKTIAASTGIQFCLASITPDSVPTNGIERRYSANESWSAVGTELKTYTQGGLDPWDRRYYMNIWVANLDGNVLGLTQMPGGPPQTDGMCILYKAFGRVGNHLDPRYNLGRTVTHETGHWLGLYHTWGDDGGNCEATGGGTDLMNDTPDQGDNTFGCPLFPVTDACSPVYPGIMFMDYMDYTDDACMNMFTNDQSAKMKAILNTTRISILQNQSCNEAITVSLPIKLFPNPVTDHILVHTYFNVAASIDFSLKDIFGRELMHQSGSLSSYEVASFNVSTIPGGVYLITVKANSYSITEKVVVAHR